MSHGEDLMNIMLIEPPIYLCFICVIKGKAYSWIINFLMVLGTS